jgi:hypothetical protein
MKANKKEEVYLDSGFCMIIETMTELWKVDNTGYWLISIKITNLN